VRAFVLTAPGECSVQEVPAPVAASGEAVVDVDRVGVCGTDVEFFTGEMAYLHQGHAWFPMRLGHEWAVDAVLGALVEPEDDLPDLPDLPFDAVVDASNAAHLPARALDLVEPAGRVVYVGLAGSHSLIDTRTLALKDVTAVGVLSASPGLEATIRAYAGGAVDPRPLVAATVGLHQVGAVLAGDRPEGAGPGPKVHVDPRTG
jgi:threonine dehydrogenase-like Zn-dependent dehydrogenase